MPPHNYFKNENFVNDMNEILKTVGGKIENIAEAMTRFDKKKDIIEYYALDCAMCYLTYLSVLTNIEEQGKTSNELDAVIHTLKHRVRGNMELITNVTGS